MVGIALLFPLEVLARPARAHALARAGHHQRHGLPRQSRHALAASSTSGRAPLFVTAGLMALFPDYAHFIFGVVGAACFFFPGLKYYRQRLRAIVAALRGAG